MGLADTIMLLGLVALATYTQTITGFAFGLILMGGAVLLDLAPVAIVAILISLLSLFNCSIALYKNVGELDRKIVLYCALPGLVTMALGLWALELLSAHYMHSLQLLLGLSILLSSLLLVVHPTPREKGSGKVSFFLVGGLSGLMGGLFSTSAPPLVFHFYRQPLAQRAIRDSLLSIFLLHSLQRTAIVAYQGRIDLSILIISASAIPTVFLFTWVARRFPPPISNLNIRRVAFVLLVLSGVSLCVTAML